MRPSLVRIAWKMTKATARNRRLMPHLLGIARRTCANYGGLRAARRSSGGKQLVVIAAIEHMGDIVAAEPVGRLARREHPDAHIIWICRAPYRNLVGNFTSVNQVVTVGCMTEWLLLWSLLSDAIVWDLHISERACPRCGISFRKPGPPGAIVYRTYFDYGNLLAVNCLAAGIPPIEEAPELEPGPDAIASVDSLGLPDRFVVVHAKSNESIRDWRLDRWRALVAWLNGQLDLTVCEIGSDPYVLQDGARTRQLCGVLSMLESAEVIRRATLFVGVDSGPAHLANAVGTPGVILLGQYQSFYRYMPYSGAYADGAGVGVGVGADLVWGDGPAQDIPIEHVMAAISARLRGAFQADTQAAIPGMP